MATNTNKRYIDIENTNTRVGYNYIKQEFYVTNTDTNTQPYTTYRDTLQKIRNVLTAIGITEEQISNQEIQELKVYTETLYKVVYTLSNTGSYIHTLQFNDFEKYPLTLDCEKAKLYIMNSTIIYDLTLNESPRNVRIPRILSFYKDTLGLLISETDMRYFYSLLVAYYYPTCYNQVIKDTETNKYFYNNKFLLSNYSNTSNAVYQCTCNPNNTATNTQIGYVVATDTTTNTITLSEDLQEDKLQGYNKIILKGTDTYIEDLGTTYSADGEYTIASIQNNTITVKETIPYLYDFPYKECYVVTANYSISQIDRSTRQITLTTNPTNILVGDIIEILNATITTPYETISCNGSYTVQYIQDNIITVEEEIPTDITYTEQTGYGILRKEVFISNISRIYNKKLTLTDTTDFDLTGAIIGIHNIGYLNTTIDYYTVSAYTTNTITVNESIQAYNFINTCATLSIPIPTGNTEYLIDITSVSEDKASEMPVGEFLVNNFTECHDYLGTLEGLVLPTATTEGNLYKEVPSTLPLIEIPDLTTPNSEDNITCSMEEMGFKGLYSEIYKGN